jgi:hypothetical protein
VHQQTEAWVVGQEVVGEEALVSHHQALVEVQVVLVVVAAPALMPLLAAVQQQGLWTVLHLMTRQVQHST